MSGTTREYVADDSELNETGRRIERGEDDARRARAREAWLARFPEENPAPVLRVGGDGMVLYRNRAAAKSPGWQCEVGQPLAEPLRTLAWQTMAEGRPVEQTVELAGVQYSVSILPVTGEQYANLYAHDVTERYRVEAALRESEGRYRALFDRMTEGFALHEIITDAQGRPCDYRFLDVNPAFERLTGLKRENLLGRRVLEVLPGIESRWIKDYGKVALTGEPMRIENYSASLDRWYDVVAYRAAPNRFAAIFTDITTRKRMEESLRQSRADFDRAQAVGQIGSWRLDVARNVLTWSDENYHIFGIPIGTPMTYEAFLAAVHPDDRNSVDVAWNAALRGDPYDIEHRIVVGGEVKWVLEKAYLERDSAGTLLGGFGITQDITERKKSEQELQELAASLERRVTERTADLRQSVALVQAEERRFHEVLDALPVYVILLSSDYRVPFANRFFESRFGESKGRRCYEYLFQRSEPCENCETFKVLKTNAPHHWQWTGPDGRDYDIHDFPFADVDGSPLILEVGMDVTEQRKTDRSLTERTAEAQRLAERLRALANDLSRSEQRERKRLAKILHDHIQQLLVAARIQIEWVAGDDAPKRQRMAAQTLDDILKEAIEASRSLTVELSPPVLYETGLIAGLNWLAARMQQKNQFAVGVVSEDAAEPASEETRFLLFECARELLFNAFKHAGVSGATVTLARGENNHITLIVHDSGKGFDADLLRTRRADEATFGLFSIQQRLAHIGGGLEIVTAPGAGTRIILTVPISQPSDAAENVPTSAASDAPVAASSVTSRAAACRVLVVDDHRIVREGLARLIEMEPDIEVVGQAADGPQAIELAEKLQPDVIIMDVNLGQMSGAEAARAILARNPSVRIIALSMHEDEAVARAMRAAGVAAYLTKGGPSRDLIAAVRACRA